MNTTVFKESLPGKEPPGSASVYLKALWYDAKGDWSKAHELIQDMEDQNACRIHAYLHRKEGDAFNANYWYRRAGTGMPSFSLTEEWEQILTALSGTG